MEIIRITDGRELTLRLTGRLDTATAPRFVDEVEHLGLGVRELVLDFSDLEYVSSAGLRALLMAQKKMSARGGMKLLNVGENIREVFNITGFADILRIE